MLDIRQAVPEEFDCKDKQIEELQWFATHICSEYLRAKGKDIEGKDRFYIREKAQELLTINQSIIIKELS